MSTRAEVVKEFGTTLHHDWLWGWYATLLKKADVRDPRYRDFYGPVDLKAGLWASTGAAGRSSDRRYCW